MSSFKKTAKKFDEKKVNNFLNILIVALLLLVGFLALRAYPPESWGIELPTIGRDAGDGQQQNTSNGGLGNQNISELISSERVYPEGFSDEQKLAIALQEEEVTDEFRNAWTNAVSRLLGNEADTLELVSVGSDCFGLPTVFRLKDGEPLRIRNTTDSALTLGSDDIHWEVGAGETIEVEHNFSVPEADSDEGAFTGYFFGYSCGAYPAPSGLFFIE